jgi:hypothetical protein
LTSLFQVSSFTGGDTNQLKIKTNLILFFLAALGVLPVAPRSAAQTPPSPLQPVYRLDLTRLNQLDMKNPRAAREAWDTLHVVASIQGIVNRNGANLFVRFMPETDDFWWNYLRTEQGWLKDRPVIPVQDVADLARRFLPRLNGVVLYDEKVPATANLASTIAGVENRMALRYDASPDSVYSQLATLPQFPKNVLKLFRNDGSPLFTGRGVISGTTRASTGSAKNDAYLWAKLRYLDARRCSPNYLAYYIDSYWLGSPGKPSNCTLENHDFFISRGAFFFDLDMWEDEAPVDDPAQKPGTDAATLKAIMRLAQKTGGNHILTVGGFVPWVWKYCDAHPDRPGAKGKHEPVPSEWKFASLLSSYNAVMDADAPGYAGLANSSFYQHFPLKKRYPQNARPTVPSLQARGLIQPNGKVKPLNYVAFYMGDYDSSSWLSQFAPKWWADAQHGKIPCNWAFDPNLDYRVPQVLDYVRTHQSSNDWFISGDCGAGYLNPGLLAAPRLDPSIPDGWELWTQYNLRYFHRYDLTITGFIIEGLGPWIGERGLDDYSRFSPDGLMISTVSTTFDYVGLHRGVMPYLRHQMDLTGTPAAAADDIVARVAQEKSAFAGGPQFLMPRTILKSPSWHAKTMAAVHALPGGKQVEFVDSYTFFLLLKHQLASQQ